MLKVACDFHGVLGDLHKTIIKMAKEKYGYDIDPAQCTHWKWWETTPIKKEEFWTIVDEINNTGKTPEIPVVAGAQEFFPQLYYSYPTEILTALPAHTVPDLKRWLKVSHFPRDVPIVPTGIANTAGGIKYTYPFGLYIDDNPYMVGENHEANPDKILILLDQPWNRSIGSKPVVCNNKNEFRAKDWQEIISLCHQIQNIL